MLRRVEEVNIKLPF